jgi:hypothetical protein
LILQSWTHSLCEWRFVKIDAVVAVDGLLEAGTRHDEQASLRKQEIAHSGLVGQRTQRADAHAIDEGMA